MLFRYYAIRVAETIVFKRSRRKITKLRSVITSKRNGMRIEQISYIGGVILGTMPYAKWVACGCPSLKTDGCLLIPKSTYIGCRPYIIGRSQQKQS